MSTQRSVRRVAAPEGMVARPRHEDDVAFRVAGVAGIDRSR